MATIAPLDTAKIYEFPAGGRASPNRSAKRSAARPASAKIVRAEYGGAWYHEAAIKDAEPTAEIARPVHLFTDRI